MIGLSRNQDQNSTPAHNAKIPVLAALSGLAVGALAALGVAVPTMQHSFALQTKDLQNKLALTAGYVDESQSPETAVSPAECVQPGMGGGEVLGASTSAPESALPVGGMGGVAPSESTQNNNPGSSQQPENVPFVKQLISGTFAKASIANTGPYSTNVVKTAVENKVDVTNTNNVYVSNQADQSSQTGSASVKDNTNAGAATSGNADNSSSASLSLDITNN